MNIDRIIDTLLIGASVAGIATAAWVILTTPVLSQQHDPHDPGHWYPAACCNLRDCFEVSPELLTPTADGWRYEMTGEVIPYDRVRTTPVEAGGTFHICTHGGNPQGQIIGRTFQSGHCVWTPQLGG